MKNSTLNGIVKLLGMNVINDAIFGAFDPFDADSKNNSDGEEHTENYTAPGNSLPVGVTKMDTFASNVS